MRDKNSFDNMAGWSFLGLHSVLNGLVIQSVTQRSNRNNDADVIFISPRVPSWEEVSFNNGARSLKTSGHANMSLISSIITNVIYSRNSEP